MMPADQQKLIREVVELIKLVVLAERKRCADVAREYDTLQGDYAGGVIADAIEANP